MEGTATASQAASPTELPASHHHHPHHHYLDGDAQGPGQPNSCNHDGLDSESEWSEEDIVAMKRYDNAASSHHVQSKVRLNQSLKPEKEGRAKVGNHHFTGLSRMRKDGRVNISVSETERSGYLAKAVGSSLERQLQTDSQQQERNAERERIRILQEKGEFQVPPMNIVVMVIGSRGDIQPFLKIGKILQDKYHHRVRIATHPKFRSFVKNEMGLEFFSVGGDPSELMAYMVKNPGLMPSMETIKAGEITRRRDDMFVMMNGFWRACINNVDDEEDLATLKSLDERPPFIADAIIANPPSFAHYHCAEKLGCPLHLVFTFPYTPTQAFPHPLANIKTSNSDPSHTNYMSYPLVDLLTWQGLGDLVNKFRVNALGLEPVSTLWAPGQFTRMRVPTTYMWSPSLVPKPADWGPEVDVVGYVFLDTASNFKPPEDMVQFLRRDGPDQRPILYIGFGSISGVSDPQGFARMIFDAVTKANVRAIIARGWGGMGDSMEKPDGVFMVDSVPHDWLFPQIDAVVHHGGAGTTANGLKFGKPTMIVPFFGDQPFWSAMVAKAGAGAKESLPLKKLDADKFAEGIKECLQPEAKAKAQEIAAAIASDGDGAQNVVDSFHRSLPLDSTKSMRCSIFPDRVAVWRIKRLDWDTETRLSPLAACLLVENKVLQWTDLSLLATREWFDFQGAGEPITGAGGAIVSSLTEAFQGLESIGESAKKDLKDHEQAKKRQTKDLATTENGVVQNGKASMGNSYEAQKKQLDKLNDELKLGGESEPLRSPAWKKSRRSERRVEESQSQASLEPGAVIVAKDVGKGLGQTAKAIVCLPPDLLFAITLGFRNAPRLYGDRTVRPLRHPILGFRKGVLTAGEEFYHGIYDGITGVVRLPIHDVREGGAVELPKGIARGLGALVLKPLAGTLGLAAYPTHGALQGLHARLRDTAKTKRWICRARIIQGMRDVKSLKHQSQNRQAPSQTGQEIADYEKLRSVALAKWRRQPDTAPDSSKYRNQPVGSGTS